MAHPTISLDGPEVAVPSFPAGQGIGYPVVHPTFDVSAAPAMRC